MGREGATSGEGCISESSFHMYPPKTLLDIHKRRYGCYITIIKSVTIHSRWLPAILVLRLLSINLTGLPLLRNTEAASMFSSPFREWSPTFRIRSPTVIRLAWAAAPFGFMDVM